MEGNACKIILPVTVRVILLAWNFLGRVGSFGVEVATGARATKAITADRADA